MMLDEAAFWTIFTAVAWLAVWAVYRALVGRKMDGRPRCPRCWYDMTGSPSLTCPECGHDAHRPERLHRRRRYRWRLIDAGMIGVLLWYSLHVRHRVMYTGEMPTSAMVPTSVLIVRSSAGMIPKDVQETLIARLFPPNAAEPQLPDWQVWATARATFQSLKSNPPTSLRDRRMELMHRLTYHSPKARSLWAKLMLESPAVSDAMVADLSYRGQHLQTEEVADAVWELHRQNRLMPNNGPGEQVWLFALSRLSGLPDAKLVDEAKLAMSAVPLSSQWEYIEEMKRRRLPQLERVIADAPGDGYMLRTWLLRSELRRLQNKPPPIALTLTRHKEFPTVLVLEMKVIDPGWPTVRELRPVAGRVGYEPPPDPVRPLHLQVITSTGEPNATWSQVWRWWAARPILEPGTLDADHPWEFLIDTADAPPNCRLQAVLIQRDDEIIIDGRFKPPPHTPVSNVWTIGQGQPK